MGPFEKSLLNPAVTSGRNANCFFQSFMHVLTRLPDEIHAQLFSDSKYQLPLHYLVENFNATYETFLPKQFNFKEIILFAKTLHPLDREYLFGPILRGTFNALVKNKVIQTEPLGLGDDDIVLAHQTVAFANSFGAELNIYMSEQEFNKARTNGMPPEIADRISMHPIEVGEAIFVLDRLPNQPKLWQLNLVYAGIHLNYTLGTPELNQQEREQVEISQTIHGAYFASAPSDLKSSPIASASTNDVLVFRMSRLFREDTLQLTITELLSKNAGFFRTLENTFLQDHRHDTPEMQHEYDKQFGLITRSK